MNIIKKIKCFISNMNRLQPPKWTPTTFSCCSCWGLSYLTSLTEVPRAKIRQEEKPLISLHLSVSHCVFNSFSLSLFLSISLVFTLWFSALQSVLIHLNLGLAGAAEAVESADRGDALSLDCHHRYVIKALIFLSLQSLSARWLSVWPVSLWCPPRRALCPRGQWGYQRGRDDEGGDPPALHRAHGPQRPGQRPAGKRELPSLSCWPLNSKTNNLNKIKKNSSLIICVWNFYLNRRAMKPAWSLSFPKFLILSK